MCKVKIQQNREEDLLDGTDTRHQEGRIIESRAVLLINHQTGQLTKKEGHLIMDQITDHLGERDINKGGDLILDVMAPPPRGEDQEGTLPDVLHSHLQEKGVIDQEVPRLGNSKVRGADDTPSHQMAQCGGDHQLQEALHSNKTVFVAVINIQAWSVPTMRTIGEPHVVCVTYNTPQRVINGGAGLPTETTSRWVA